MLFTGGLDVMRKEAWHFYRTCSGVRLCWELKEPTGPEEVKCGTLLHTCVNCASAVQAQGYLAHWKAKRDPKA